jgi:hypothetical protein
VPSASSITQRAAKAAEGAAYHYDMAKNDLFYYENQIGDPSDEFIAQLKIIQNYYAEVMEAVDRAREAVRKGQINQAERYVEHAENTLYPLSFASADLLAILEDDDFSMILTGDREISPLRSNPPCGKRSRSNAPLRNKQNRSDAPQTPRRLGNL